jgi:hypothetical protein
MQERRRRPSSTSGKIESILFFGRGQLVTTGARTRRVLRRRDRVHLDELEEPRRPGHEGDVRRVPRLAVLAHGEMSNKVFFAAPLVARILSTYVSVGLGSAWGTDAMQSASAKFGVHVNGFISGAYGAEIPIIVKREWSDMAATTSGYGSYGFGIDLGYTTLRPLRDTVLLTNRQANDADTIDEEYLTEFSLEFQQESAHLVVKGATS